MEKIHKIGKYLVMETIGCGGFSTVYCCREEDTNRHFALKVGNDCIKDEYKEKKQVIEEMVHMEEWHAYKALGFGKGKANDHGIPEVFETGGVRISAVFTIASIGIAQLPNGTLRPYLVMQRLGKYLLLYVKCVRQCDRNLLSIVSDSTSTKERILELSRSMLETVEYVHKSGYIHRDIKPSNFCFPIRSGRSSMTKVYLLDFGFACEKPMLKEDVNDDFVGTPDYASTTALRGKRQGFRDDLESLAYTILELWLGDLPWYLTSGNSLQGGWTKQNLTAMSNKRERKWKSLKRLQRIPAFLLEWVSYCKELDLQEEPDYAYLHSLLSLEHDRLQVESKMKRKGLSDAEESEDPDSSPLCKRACFHSEE